MILGERHFNYLVSEWLGYYHEERPHQSLDNAPLKKPKPYGRPTKQHASVEKQVVPQWEVRCKQRLGGLLKAA